MINLRSTKKVLEATRAWFQKNYGQYHYRFEHLDIKIRYESEDGYIGDCTIKNGRREVSHAEMCRRYPNLKPTQVVLHGHNVDFVMYLDPKKEEEIQKMMRG